MPEITTKDLFCAFFLVKSNGKGLDAYDRTLDLLIPRLRESSFISIASCYYVNSHKYGSGVRLSCLLPRSVVDEFSYEMSQIINNLNLHQERDPQGPKTMVWYSDEELEIRYRRYLALQNKIGLDLLETDRIYAREAIAFVRCKFKPWEDTFRTQLEPILEAMSQTYKSLNDIDRDSFFEDLSTKPNPHDYAWFHQFVNLILTREPKFCRLKTNATIEEINDCLALIGLPTRIPDNWKSGIPFYESR